MRYIYADQAATTRLSREARNVYIRLADQVYGNPSSLHAPGQEAAGILSEARAATAHCLGALPEEVYFTSGGSESNNQAVYSAIEYGKKIGKKHIVSTQIEHHSV
ncbi:MAG: aminotransferase class V-fold PLP-dependent enzyme, partial [Parasporobacterium sp.]|nr:aminotransferase class V-fold PLP-dependent enzyme [Parasporobacterium sp.]